MKKKITLKIRDNKQIIKPIIRLNNSFHIKQLIVNCFDDESNLNGISDLETLKNTCDIYYSLNHDQKISSIKTIFKMISDVEIELNEKKPLINWYYEALDKLIYCCSVSGCSNKRGIFPECKSCFDKDKYYINGKSFIWSPPQEGYKTIQQIASDYPDIININQISVNDINDGKRSKISICCYICGYKWKSLLDHIFNISCKSCTGRLWTVQRIHQRCLLRPDINFDKITLDYKIDNVKTAIIVSCKQCNYEYSTSIKNIFNNCSNCIRCIGKEVWSLERLQREAANRPELNFSKVTQEHITAKKSKSHIPVICNICNYGNNDEWWPCINDIFNSNSGCPECDHKKWTWNKFQKECKNKPEINFSHITEKDINNGCLSVISVSCNVVNCGYEWTTTITNIFINNYGCSRCVNCEKWTYQKICDNAHIRPEFDFSQVTQNHITDGKNSKIPIICRVCDHEWNPSITGVFVKKNGCEKCSKLERWTYKRFLRDCTTYTDIDFSKVTEDHIKNGSLSKIPVICNKCGYEWTATIKAIFNQHYGCKNCAKCVPWTFERLQIDKSKLPQFNFDKVKESHINKGGDSLIPIICNDCHHEFERIIDNIFNRQGGCPRCNKCEPWTVGKVQREQHKRSDLNFSNIEEQDVTNVYSIIFVSCNLCEYLIEMTIYQIFHDRCLCPQCNLYKGPRAIMMFLTDNKIEYEVEKKFAWLKYVDLLKIDVYVSKYPGINIPICIEYDGNFPGTHFNNYRGNEEKDRHLLCLKRDMIKDKNVILNGIHLVRIPYSAFMSGTQNEMNDVLITIFELLKKCEQPILHYVNPETYLKRDICDVSYSDISLL